MDHERRKHPRLRFELAVDVRSGHSLFSARTADISEGGVFIRTRSRIRIGSEIHLGLRLDHEHVSIIGVVSWVFSGDDGQVQGVGVAFRSMSPFARDTLRRFMRAHAPAHHGAPRKVDEPPRPTPRSRHFEAIFRE